MENELIQFLNEEIETSKSLWHEHTTDDRNVMASFYEVASFYEGEHSAYTKVLEFVKSYIEE
jgi:hypothetical protein